MNKTNDGRKHWRFGRIYEKEQAQLWIFLRKAWENFGATVLAKIIVINKFTATVRRVLLTSLVWKIWKIWKIWKTFKN